MKLHTLHSNDEMREDLRTCRRCGKWIPLFRTVDEHGQERDYDRAPAFAGLCTCYSETGKQYWPETPTPEVK